MKFSHQAVIHAPADEVDLEQWLFSLSDSDYQAAAHGHRAAGTFTEGGRRGSVNVEAIGSLLMIQHYLEREAGPARVEMLSERSQAYLFHLIPVHVLVRWIMTATPQTANTTTFACDVEIEMPFILRLAGVLIGNPFFVRKHVEEETPGFVADIERKLSNARAKTSGGSA
ncbi:hypothetical protein BN1232_01723 [Mycobacterium lentiflavum]|uniref:Polyketide cyclase / dehydrase and lipid transport n=1 Tax=Mycobacterium lentiflavum TaxID=141349 RepID=A0A0E4CMF3_MYCLN|nr:hypothetical protein [Mycobacterium lentiflavum]ULP43808.1 hypothetical protein MJO58_07580 [Mycobacterium lentiflavum]CQD09459.1 hypothetical protein BN1232_01723 [Mycobacterium lentiflavum]